MGMGGDGMGMGGDGLLPQHPEVRRGARGEVREGGMRRAGVYAGHSEGYVFALLGGSQILGRETRP